jgi:futalosine hydrolase
VTILVLTAVRAEAATAVDGFAARQVRIGRYEAWVAAAGAGPVVAVAGGVGPARAAAAGTYVLGALRQGAVEGLAEAGWAGDEDEIGLRPHLVVAGIGGGFAGRAAIGDVVVADRILHADLGADSPAGFLPGGDLGLGPGGTGSSRRLVAAAAERTGAVVGPIVTVSTVTGTAAGAAELVRRHDPAAEGMEGAGGWAAAEAYGVPVLEIRAISNLVGPRDRDGWEIPRALGALRQAMMDLLTEPLP